MTIESANAYLRGLFSLEGRTALVTGGGGYLGGAIASGLGQAGARVAIVGRRLEKLEQGVESLRAQGVEAMAAAADCNDRGAVEQALGAVEEKFGPVDILVNAAGGNLAEATVKPGDSFFDIDPDAMRRVVDINLMAGAIIPSVVVGRRLEALNRSGSIINIASVSSMLPLTRIAGYSAAKAAVKSFTEWLAVHLAQRGEPLIRVNAIVPGFFVTEQNRFLLTTEDGGLTERGQTIVEQTPMGRFGEPDELVGAAVWLAGGASGFVTGISLEVDGGFCAFSGV